MEYDLILPLNKRQILLDWVNTIDEPKCLLVSELSNLEDGSVFLEILKNFLYKTKEFPNYYNLFENTENLNLKMRYELIFQILADFVSEDKLKIFLPIEKLVTNSRMLLAFINLIKSLYEFEKDKYKEVDYFSSQSCVKGIASPCTNRSVKKVGKSGQVSDKNNLSLMESDTSSKINKRHDLYEFSEKEGERVTYISDIEAMNKSRKYNFRKNFESDYEHSNYSIVSEENKFEKIKQLLEKDKKETDMKLHLHRNKDNEEMSINKFRPKIPQEMKITNSNFNIINKNNKASKSNRISPNESRSSSPKLNSNLLNKYKEENKEYTPNQSFIKDNSKLYSRQEKAELMMSRGLPSKAIAMEINNRKFSFYKFLKPSEPVININFSDYEKYLPCCEQIRIASVEPIILVDKSNISNRDKRVLPSQLSTLNVEGNSNNSCLKDFKSEDLSFRKANLPSNNFSPSTSLKNKIYFWLIDLNILKENSIQVEDMPKLCANGVLLADLINRLEGRSESIKGIVRKTSLKSHIQVNINKILDYLRSIPKFNTRHLWSNSEIASADEKVVWELLDDIWQYFSNKNNPCKSKRKTKNNSNSTPIKDNISQSFLPPDVSNISVKTKSLANILEESKRNIKKLESNESNKSFLNISSKNSSSNLNVIANCLGMETSRAIRKIEGPKAISSITYKLNSSNNRKISFTPIKNTKLKENSLLDQTSKDNKNKEPFPKDNLFIIFQKSNAKKLKKEIDRYTSDSIKNSHHAIKNEQDQFLNEDINYFPQSNVLNKAHSLHSLNCNQIISTEESSKSKPKVRYDSEKEENGLREWMVTLGVKGACNLDLSKDFIKDFKDGQILASLISILENKKVPGINPVAKSHAVALKNISKSLEILRTKKNMPFDYLWCEEEISRGEGSVIRSLLKQIKKAYTRDR